MRRATLNSFLKKLFHVELSPKRVPNAVLILGITSGIGQAIGKLLCKKGYNVLGTSTRGEINCVMGEFISIHTFPAAPYNLIKFNAKRSNNFEILLSHQTVKNDVVAIINCIGIDIAGNHSDLYQKDLEDIMKINYAPHMLIAKACSHIKRSLKIISIGSIAADIPLPYFSLYCSSKAALQALVENLAVTDHHQHILVKPGNIKTNFTNHRKIRGDSAEASIAIKKMAEDEQQGRDPIVVARVVANILRMKSPKPVYIVASLIEWTVIILKHILPSKLYFKIIRRFYIP